MIDKHWDKTYTYLNGRCNENENGVFSTWRNKRTAYDRIKKVWRTYEAHLENLVGSPELIFPILSHRSVNANKFGQLVSCSYHPLLRRGDYTFSGTNNTTLRVSVGKGREPKLITAFPAY